MDTKYIAIIVIVVIVIAGGLFLGLSPSGAPKGAVTADETSSQLPSDAPPQEGQLAQSNKPVQPVSTVSEKSAQPVTVVVNEEAAGASTMTFPNGLIVQDSVVGTGVVAQSGRKVAVSYVGRLADGTKFDASADHGGTFTFDLGAGQVIKGWDQGVVGMKEGGKRKLVIPPDLAYGSRGVGPIPPNATLTFEVELVKVY